MGRHCGWKSERAYDPPLEKIRAQRRKTNLGRGSGCRFARRARESESARDCAAHARGIGGIAKGAGGGTPADDGFFIGLQLTHSGRYCRPNTHDRPEPRILYHHPILDGKLRLPYDYPILTDGEIRAIIEEFHRAAGMASEMGFDFVDIKHCHGYLGHEFLSAHTREGKYGGSFE